MKLLTCPQELEEALGTPHEYFQFPVSAYAFCVSYASQPGIHRECLYRVRRSSLTIVSYRDPELLAESVSELMQQGYLKVGSLNYVSLPRGRLWTSKGPPEFFIQRGWQPRLDKKSRYELKRGLRTYHTERLDPERLADEVDALMKQWIGWAGGRHFMVFKGHYLQYINQWKCGHPDVSLLGFREIDSGELFGIFGFEIFDGAAQITLAKHRGGDYCFATFMWCTGLEVILDLGVDLCYCGSTADSLKRRLGLREWESFKLRGWEGKPWNKMLG